MAQDVQTGSGDVALWYRVHKLGVNDGHVRRQSVIGQWVLHVGLGVRNHSERRYFGPGPGSGWDRHHLGLLRLVEAIGPLTDVQELLLCPEEGSIFVLVEHPHPLGGVQRRTPTQSDNRVRLEALHQGDTFFNRRRGWIGFDIGEDQVLDIVFPQPQLVGHHINVAVGLN